MDNYTKYKELREKFGEFVYESYEIDETENEIILAYNFSIKGLSDFRPEWRIPKKKENGAISEKLIFFKKEAEENLTLKKLIFSLGMIELISYWKRKLRRMNFYGGKSSIFTVSESFSIRIKYLLIKTDL